MTDASSLTIISAVEAALRKRGAELKNLEKRKSEFNTLLVNHYVTNTSSCKKQKTAAQACPYRPSDLGQSQEK